MFSHRRHRLNYELYLDRDLARAHDLSPGREALLGRSRRHSGRWQSRLRSPGPLVSNLPTRRQKLSRILHRGNVQLLYSC